MSLWKFQGKRAHIYLKPHALLRLTSHDPPQIGGRLSVGLQWRKLRFTEMMLLHKVPHPERGKAEIQTLAPKPTLPLQTTSSMELKRCEVWWRPVPYAHRDPANTLGLQGHETGADTTTPHLLPNVLSPPCETPWCHFPSPLTTTSWAPAHLSALLTTAMVTGWCKKKSCLWSFSPNTIHLSKAVASKILL